MEDKEFDIALKDLKKKRDIKIQEIKDSFKQRLSELEFNKECEEDIKENISKVMVNLKNKEIEGIKAITQKAKISQVNKTFIPKEYIDLIRDNQNEYLSLREEFIDLILSVYKKFYCEDNTSNNSTEVKSTSSASATNNSTEVNSISSASTSNNSTEVNSISSASTSNYSINSISTIEALEEGYDYIGLSINPVHHNNCG